MKKIIYSLVLVAVSLYFGACVEVRDDETPTVPVVESSPPPKPVAESPPFHAPSSPRKELVIDQEMHLYRGEILTMDEINRRLGKFEEYDWSPAQVALTYDKIVFTNEKAVLYIHGHRLNLKVEEMDSTGGTISTYEPEREALPFTKGRDGGQLLLEVTKGRGSVSIEMHGEPGGKGLPGDPAPSRDYEIPYCDLMNGYPGKPGEMGGKSGSAILKLPPSGSLYAKIEVNGGTGGPGGDGGGPFASYAGATNSLMKCDNLGASGGFSFKKPEFGPKGPEGSEGAREKSFIYRPGEQVEIFE